MTDIEQIIKRRAFYHGVWQGMIAGIIFVAVFAAIIFFGCKAHAADNVYDVQFSLEEYPATPELKGFNIYQEGKQVGQITDLKTREGVISVTLAPLTCFTATAHGIDPEQESKHSEKVCIKRPLEAPVMVRPKYYRRYIDAGPVVAPVK